MEQSGKIAGALIAFLSAASLVFGVILLRSLYINVKVKILREEVDYLRRDEERMRDDLERKEKELSAIREEFSVFKKQVLDLQKRLTDDHRELVLRAAQILSLRDYIDKLEAACLKAGAKLPKRDRVRWEEES